MYHPFGGNQQTEAIKNISHLRILSWIKKTDHSYEMMKGRERERQWGRQTVSKLERGRINVGRKYLTGRQIKEGERVVEKGAEIWSHVPLPLSPLIISHPSKANPLCVFHHPVCASVCLSSVTASLLPAFDSGQKWLASQAYRHRGHDSACLCATLCEQRRRAVNWCSLLDKPGTEKQPYAKTCAVNSFQGLRTNICPFRLFIPYWTPSFWYDFISLQSKNKHPTSGSAKNVVGNSHSATCFVQKCTQCMQKL